MLPGVFFALHLVGHYGFLKAMPEAYYQLKRLDKLAEKCGVSTKPKMAESTVDTSNMTAYEKQQHLVASTLQRVRNNIMELDNLGDKGSAQKRSELGNAIRRDLEKCRTETAQAKKFAKEENRKSDYDKLVHHFKKTESVYTARFRAQDDSAHALVSGGGNRVTQLDEEMTQLGQPMVNLRDDEEFQLFFEQTRVNDQKIDQALDRISAGVQVLHQNALQISEELKVQNKILDETEEKVTKVQGKLTGLNKRLKKTIKDVEKDKLCIYLICFLLLLGLGGAIYWQLTKNKK